MSSLTRRDLVALAALCPVAVHAPGGSAAADSGPPPTPPELEAFLDRGHRGARISGTDALTPTPVPAHATRTDSGRPSSSIRFRARAAMATSVARPGSVRERNASPITRL